MNLNRKIERRGPRTNQVFRHLRMNAGLTTRELANLIGCNSSLITHWETGKNPIAKHRVKQLCKVFRISESDLNAFESGKEMPINYRDECLLILHKLDSGKLQAIYHFLNSMGSN